jgi:dihydrodipicolinate synthase/N-acetylneuraminate lyase
MTPFQERINGSIPALLTALDEKFAVDRDAMQRTTRRVIDNGCQGVVVVGTSGEFAGIDDDQREIAIQAVVEEVSGQVPVIVGCGQPNVRRTHEQARAAADLGVDGLLVNPPFYFPMTQDEVVSFFADLVAISSLPVLLYNIPGLTNVAVEPATIPRLRDVGVQGTKDSSGIPANTLAYLAALESDSDFRVVTGGEVFFLHLLDAGVCATTGLLPNVAPQLAAQIHHAWQAGDYKAAFAAQHRANAFAALFRPLNGFLHATGKAVLSRLGLMEKWVAPPKTPLTDAEADHAFETLKEFLPEFENHELT